MLENIFQVDCLYRPCISSSTGPIGEEYIYMFCKRKEERKKTTNSFGSLWSQLGYILPRSVSHQRVGLTLQQPRSSVLPFCFLTGRCTTPRAISILARLEYTAVYRYYVVYVLSRPVPSSSFWKLIWFIHGIIPNRFKLVDPSFPMLFVVLRLLQNALFCPMISRRLGRFYPKTRSRINKGETVKSIVSISLILCYLTMSRSVLLYIQTR